VAENGAAGIARANCPETPFTPAFRAAGKVALFDAAMVVYL
jgi:hypothetical protein